MGVDVLRAGGHEELLLKSEGRRLVPRELRCCGGSLYSAMVNLYALNTKTWPCSALGCLDNQQLSPPALPGHGIKTKQVCKVLLMSDKY